MEFVESSGKLGKPRTVIPNRSNASSSPSEEPQPSTSKRMKLKLNGNVDPAVKNLDPLLIPDVVKNISSYLVDVEDMKSIRSLNSLWRDECLDKWRSTAVLILTEEVIQVLVEAYLRKNDPRLESTLNDVLIQLFDKPFRNFRYPSDSDGRNRIYPPQLMDIGGPSSILWEQFFSRAKYLDLADCIMKDEFYYLEGFKWIFLTCPELKRLDLNPYYYHDHSGVETRLAILNHDAGVGSNLEVLSIGESFAASFMDYKSGGFRLRNILDVNIHLQPQFPGTPLQSLFQLCPNLKNLWMQGNAWKLLNAAQLERLQLESLAIVPGESYHLITDDVADLRQYLGEARSPLKTLVLWLDTRGKLFPRQYPEEPLFYDILNLVQGTLTKLELYIDCEMGGIPKNRPLNLSWEVGARTFSNLTHLKLCQDYSGNFSRTLTLISFDFGSLRQMKKLKEFRFEMGVGVAEALVKKKLGVEDIQGKKKKDEDNLSLPDLKHFHFHSNFTSEAIQFLGKVAANLKTLEVVLDGENFATALNTWTGLSQITLLACSEVPKELFGPEGIRIVDRSNDYRKASFGWFNYVPLREYEVHQMKRFSKLTKPC